MMVQKWNLFRDNTTDCLCEMDWSDHGEWVLYDDYLSDTIKLLDRIYELEVDNKTLASKVEEMMSQHYC